MDKKVTLPVKLHKKDSVKPTPKGPVSMKSQRPMNMKPPRQPSRKR